MKILFLGYDTNILYNKLKLIENIDIISEKKLKKKMF